MRWAHPSENNEIMKTNYNGTDIAYQERENNWIFELRGRERVAESLAAAKEAIDKPYSAKADGPQFERFPAWVKYDGTLRLCTVTSEAYSRYHSKMFWITLDPAQPSTIKRRVSSADKRRMQANHYDLFRRTPENDKLAAQRIDLDKEIERLHEERNKRQEQMHSL